MDDKTDSTVVDFYIESDVDILEKKAGFLQRIMIDKVVNKQDYPELYPLGCSLRHLSGELKETVYKMLMTLPLCLDLSVMDENDINAQDWSIIKDLFKYLPVRRIDLSESDFDEWTVNSIYSLVEIVLTHQISKVDLSKANLDNIDLDKFELLTKIFQSSCLMSLDLSDSNVLAWSDNQLDLLNKVLENCTFKKLALRANFNDINSESDQEKVKALFTGISMVTGLSELDVSSNTFGKLNDETFEIFCSSLKKIPLVRLQLSSYFFYHRILNQQLSLFRDAINHSSLNRLVVYHHSNSDYITSLPWVIDFIKDSSINYLCLEYFDLSCFEILIDDFCKALADSNIHTVMVKSPKGSYSSKDFLTEDSKHKLTAILHKNYIHYLLSNKDIPSLQYLVANSFFRRNIIPPECSEIHRELINYEAQFGLKLFNS